MRRPAVNGRPAAKRPGRASGPPVPPVPHGPFWNRLGLRARLTLLYGVLFFLAGSTLLWISYLLTAWALNQRFVVRVDSTRIPGAGPAIGPTSVPSTQVPLPQELPKEYTRDVVTAFQQRADSVLDEVLRYSVLVMILVGLVALALGYLVADRALRPLDRVTETAERLSESNLHERIALSGPNDEVKRLADTFDAMLDRLHRVFDAQRRFIANASHELRTPLAINRTVLEVSLEEPDASPDLKAMARALLGTNARYERLIEGLLLLAQSEQELVVRRSVDLRPVVLSVLEQLDLQPRKRNVTVHRDLALAVVPGDPLLLERCVHNLLENAIKYNVRGGDVWVTLRDLGAPPATASGNGLGAVSGTRSGVKPGTGTAAEPGITGSVPAGGASGTEPTTGLSTDSETAGDRMVVLSVENTGPLVPPHEVEDLFEPFHRTQGERVRSAKGAGLGLSIVRAIVDAHAGTVEARARAEGGLAITVRLPVT